jgi:tRNA-specific 2-thiouridylase
MSVRPKVLLAMSGGVDSSVSAVLLRAQGYDVVGVFMRLGSPGDTLDEMTPADDEPSCDPRRVKLGHQGCCSVSDAADARLVAAQLGIPFYVVNFKKDFGRIMDYFTREYLDGRTPNPCVRCNDWLKFGKLHEYAGQIGAAFVASGHYARVDQSRLLRGLDHAKDQSYVLFGVPRDRLATMLLPIGGLHKSEVRRIAQEHALPVFNKPDSQEICFVPDNDYAKFVERHAPAGEAPAAAGRILDPAGNDVGEHPGQHHFTIGQRRRVGVALGYPVFVVGKDPQANTITVGPRDLLLAKGCTAGEANWLIDEHNLVARPVLAKFRYNSGAVPATVTLAAPATGAHTHSGRTGRFEVVFDEPQEAVTPGQAIVIYDRAEPDHVLGGGWIESTRKD